MLPSVKFNLFLYTNIFYTHFSNLSYYIDIDIGYLSFKLLLTDSYAVIISIAIVFEAKSHERKAGFNFATGALSYISHFSFQFSCICGCGCGCRLTYEQLSFDIIIVRRYCILYYASRYLIE